MILVSLVHCDIIHCHDIYSIDHKDDEGDEDGYYLFSPAIPPDQQRKPSITIVDDVNNDDDYDPDDYLKILPST